MKIELSNEQFRELFLSKIAASYMSAFAGDDEDDDDMTSEYDRKEYLALYADNFGCSDMVEFVDGEMLVKTDVVQNLAMTILNNFCEASLPVTLSFAMAMRDLETAVPGSTSGERMLTKKENEMLRNDLTKYMKEFAGHWVERLQIVE